MRTYVKREEDEDCGGCGCFGGSKKRPQIFQRKEAYKEKPQELILQNQKKEVSSQEFKVNKSKEKQ